MSPGFFDALGAHVSEGRLPVRDEQQANGPLTAVISDAFWRRNFNASPGAVGSTVKYSERVFTITGVLAQGQRFPASADIFVPAWIFPQSSERSAHNNLTIARLRDGVTVEQANAELLAISKDLARDYPESNQDKLAEVIPLQEQMVGQTRSTLFTLLGAVGLVLLIACANVANLLLARAASREREIAVRAALGANRARLIRQLLTESAALGIVAALCGTWLARLGMLGLVAMAPANLPRLDEVRVDATALGFAIGIALLASMVFGLAPALQASRFQLADGLRQGGKGSAIGARGGRARSAFVVAEIALAVVLVAGASLLARSLAALAAVDMGFTSERLLVLQMSVPVRGSDDAARAVAFYRDLLPDVRALPGISAAAAVRSLPTIVKSNGGYRVEGDASPFTIRSPQATLQRRHARLFSDAGDSHQKRERSGGPRHVSCGTCRRDQRSAGPAVVPRTGSNRTPASVRPRSARLHDDCRCGGRREVTRARKAAATGALHAVRAASRLRYRVDDRRAHGRSRSDGARRHDPPSGRRP